MNRSGGAVLEKGSIERRGKRKIEAKRTLEQALAILEPAATAIWVARARGELSRIGLRRPVVTDERTPAPQRVAQLAAGGATNREIAQTLHISGCAVESHLTKIYNQLNIRHVLNSPPRSLPDRVRREAPERPAPPRRPSPELWRQAGTITFAWSSQATCVTSNRRGSAGATDLRGDLLSTAEDMSRSAGHFLPCANPRPLESLATGLSGA